MVRCDCNAMVTLSRSMQVATTAVEGEQLPLALSNTWVRRAHVALPPLALAADDALLTFGDVLHRTLQAADAPPHR